MTIVVSEETGKVSLAVEGELYQNIDEEFFEEKLSEGHLKKMWTTWKAHRLKRRLQNVKKLKNLLTNNIGLKFLSVLFAMILWLVVVNIDDPDKTSTLLPILRSRTKMRSQIWEKAIPLSMTVEP